MGYEPHNVAVVMSDEQYTNLTDWLSPKMAMLPIMLGGKHHYYITDAGSTKSNGFTPWFGGDCPVSDGTIVTVLLCNHRNLIGAGQYFRWDRTEITSDDDIIAYRVEQQPAEQQPAEQQPAESALSTQVGGDHYKKLTIQPIEFIHKNSLDFFQGNIIKYATRHKDKNGAADLRKVIHYAQLALELQYVEKS